jgi:hypothetical protein
MEIPTGSVCWRLNACSEAFASYHASAACYRFAENIGFMAIIELELKLSEVEWQIFLADIVIRADDSALQECPKGIEILCVYLATYIFTLSVGTVVWKLAGQVLVAYPLIGRYEVNLVADSLANEAFESTRANILDHLADEVALAADGSDHSSLAGTNAARFVPWRR